MRGRKPTPPELIQLRGNPGNRPYNTAPPRPNAEIPDMPDHLEGEAALEWDRICSYLEPLGLLTTIDRANIACYCVAVGRWVQAEREISVLGPVLVSDKTGSLYRNPWLDIANRAMDQINKFSAEFGMSPGTRARVTAAGKAQVSKWEGLTA